MKAVPKYIQVSPLKHFYKADADYGVGVANGWVSVLLITGLTNKKPAWAGFLFVAA